MAAEQQGMVLPPPPLPEESAHEDASVEDSDTEWDEDESEGLPASTPGTVYRVAGATDAGARTGSSSAPRDMTALKATYRAYASGRPGTAAAFSDKRERSASPVELATSYGCFSVCRRPRARRPSRKNSTSSLRGLRESWQRAVQNTGDIPALEAERAILRLMSAVEEEWNKPGGRAATVQINGIGIDLSDLQNDVRAPGPDPDATAADGDANDGGASSGLLRTGGWPFRANEHDAVRHLGREMLLQCLRVRGWRVDQSVQVALRFMRFRRNADWSLYFRARDVLRPLRTGMASLLPGRDRFGRAMIYVKPRFLDPALCPVEYFQQSACYCIQEANRDPVVQSKGVVIVVDTSGTGLMTLGNYTYEDLRRGALMFNCYPSRVRHTYIVHASGTMYASVKAILAMMRPVTRAKVTFVSEDLSELHEAIDPKLLPPEMGGVDGYDEWWQKYVDERLSAEGREQREVAEGGGGSNGSPALPPPVERPRRRSTARSRSLERTPPPLEERGGDGSTGLPLPGL